MFLLQGTACELHHEWVRVQVPMLPATFFRLCQVSQRLKRALVFCKEELNQDYAFVIWTFFTPCSPTCVVRGILVEDDACKYFLMPTNVPYVVESKKKVKWKAIFVWIQYTRPLVLGAGKPGIHLARGWCGESFSPYYFSLILPMSDANDSRLSHW
jgi:hypothetical protein